MIELIPGNIYVPYLSEETLNKEMMKGDYDLFYWIYIGKFCGQHCFLTSGNATSGPITIQTKSTFPDDITSL